jgi:hypothetical protein
VAEFPVVIDLGEAQVFEGHVPHAVEGAFDIHGTRLYLFEEDAKLVPIHQARITERETLL